MTIMFDKYKNEWLTSNILREVDEFNYGHTEHLNPLWCLNLILNIIICQGRDKVH